MGTCSVCEKRNAWRKFILCVLFTALPVTFLNAAVYVNQIGYLPEQLKLAYTDSEADSFYVIDVSTEQVVYTGPVILRISDDPSTGLTLYQADFTAWDLPGTFKIRTSDGEESVVFVIANSVFAQVSETLLKGLYFQRCGMALEEPYATPYTHGSCHSADAIFHSSCDTSGYRNTRGGWHDAGDYGKYVVPAANALAYLLMLHEYFPEYLSTDDLNIPESGNGRPDLLDEAKYELDWLLSMQDTTNGGVYFKVTTKDFVGFIMPDESYDTRYIYEISSTATADFAAIMARAYRVFQIIDEEYATRCLKAAQDAWQFLEAHTEIVPEGGFQNPDDTETGEYGDDDDRDERLWAAAELFEATGSSVYNDYFLAHYQEDEIIRDQASWQYVKPLAQITYLRSKQSAAIESAKNNIRNALDDYAAELVTVSQEDGFHVAMNGWEYYWGSNSVVLNKAIILIFVYEESGNEQYYNVALHQLNYILGCNAHNMTFATAIGTNAPRHIHHAPSAADGIEEPVPGLLAGGPDKYLDDPVLQTTFNINTPPALCYVDDEGSYASNEIAVYWNAPLVFVSAYFNQGQGSTSIIKRNEHFPDQLQLNQNFPNPFNPFTVISFSLPQDQEIQLKIFDVRGRLVRTLYSGTLPAGKAQFIWDGRDARGARVSSGIYIYRLSAGKFTAYKKMMFMR